MASHILGLTKIETLEFVWDVVSDVVLFRFSGDGGHHPAGPDPV